MGVGMGMGVGGKFHFTGCVLYAGAVEPVQERGAGTTYGAGRYRQWVFLVDHTSLPVVTTPGRAQGKTDGKVDHRSSWLLAVELVGLMNSDVFVQEEKSDEASMTMTWPIVLMTNLKPHYQFPCERSNRLVRAQSTQTTSSGLVAVVEEGAAAAVEGKRKGGKGGGGGVMGSSGKHAIRQVIGSAAMAAGQEGFHAQAQDAAAIWRDVERWVQAQQQQGGYQGQRGGGGMLKELKRQIKSLVHKGKRLSLSD